MWTKHRKVSTASASQASKLSYMALKFEFCFVIGHWSLRSHVRTRTSPERSVVCDPSGRSDVCCFASSVLSEHRENCSMTAENMSGRDPLSPAEEENLLSEENESANSSHQRTDKVLADELSAMTHAVHGKRNETVSWFQKTMLYHRKGGENLLQLVQ